MQQKLYHGTSTMNALSILKNGFDFTKAGSNWGKTYGSGIYFSPNYETAKFYATDKGIVLSFTIEIESYLLIKDISPTSKKRLRIPSNKNFNCIVSPNKDEYLIFQNIKS